MDQWPAWIRWFFILTGSNFYLKKNHICQKKTFLIKTADYISWLIRFSYTVTAPNDAGACIILRLLYYTAVHKAFLMMTLECCCCCHGPLSAYKRSCYAELNEKAPNVNVVTFHLHAKEAMYLPDFIPSEFSFLKDRSWFLLQATNSIGVYKNRLVRLSCFLISLAVFFYF